MIDELTVKEVIEKNDCSGRKLIYVSCEEHTETLPSRFQLTSAYMFSHDKLLLTTVTPMDRVKVVVQPDRYDLVRRILILGEYIDNLENLSIREPVCRCGRIMVSDGFDVYCPNEMCPLTISARLERLADTEFFLPPDFSFATSDPEFVDLFDPVSLGTSQMPFSAITQGLFWGRPGDSLENTLFRSDHAISLATFLIEPLFNEFVESKAFIGQGNILHKNHFTSESIFRFYGEMAEFVNRRDLSSDRQNKLIAEFMWSLGIESLTVRHIHLMTQYESISGFTTDPMVTYAYILTHASELIRELGLHRLEAAAITQEVYRRRHELCDIFTHYSYSADDVRHSFGLKG